MKILKIIKMITDFLYIKEKIIFLIKNLKLM